MTGLLTSLVAGFVTGETRQAARRAVRAVIFYSLAFFAVFVGLAFLLGAAYIEVSDHYGRRDAAIAFGVGFLLLGLLIWLGHRLFRGVRRRSAKVRRNDSMTAVGTAAAVAVLPALLKGRGALALLAVPAALLAYAIYNENVRPRDRWPPE